MSGKQLICKDFFGERAGIRTLDLLIKSQLLYRLSYALPSPEQSSAEVGGHMHARFVPVNPKIAGNHDYGRPFRRQKGQDGAFGPAGVAESELTTFLAARQRGMRQNDRQKVIGFALYIRVRRRRAECGSFLNLVDCRYIHLDRHSRRCSVLSLALRPASRAALSLLYGRRVGGSVSQRRCRGGR
jgi:hypothetical protein